MRTTRSVGITRFIGAAAILAVIGCASVEKPGPQSIAGMSPVGTVRMTEIIAAGAAGGKGNSTFQGRSYPFRLVGGVTGGGGAANTQGSGDIYNLRDISDFQGLCTQNSGGPGLAPAISGSATPPAWSCTSSGRRMA